MQLMLPRFSMILSDRGISNLKFLVRQLDEHFRITTAHEQNFALVIGHW